MTEKTRQKAKQCRMFYLDGEKFKTNTWICFFRIPLKRENATKLALLAEMLKMGTKKFPSRRELEEEAEEMYGAMWDISIVKKGSEGLLLFTLEVLKHIDNEQAADFLQGLIKEPLLEDGIFPKDRLERQKEILKWRLQSLSDNKGEFARRRATELTAEDGTGICADGYIEDLDRITAEELTQFYKDVLTHARTYLFFCGEKDGKKALRMWKKSLELQGNSFWEDRNRKHSTRLPALIREQTQASQTRLILVFTEDAQEQNSALIVWNEILGGYGNALLFRKIREEMGLCYEIRSFIPPLTTMLFVEVGLQAKDAKKTAKEITRIWDDIAENGLERTEIQQAVQNLERKYKEITEDAGRMLDFAAEEALTEKDRSLSEVIEELSEIQEKDIIQEIQKLHLHTCYVLTGEEEKKDETAR